MAKMHRLRGRPPTRVQKPRLALLVPSEDLPEVAVGEEDAALEQVMRRLAGHLLEPRDERRVNLQPRTVR